MDEIITKELFDELAATGGILFQPEEAEALRKEMNRQMAVIRQLDHIPLDGSLPPVIHGNPYPQEIRCGLREDEWVRFDNASGIIAEVPCSREGYIVSPDVPHQKIG